MQLFLTLYLSQHQLDPGAHSWSLPASTVWRLAFPRICSSSDTAILNNQLGEYLQKFVCFVLFFQAVGSHTHPCIFFWVHLSLIPLSATVPHVSGMLWTENLTAHSSNHRQKHRVERRICTSWKLPLHPGKGPAQEQHQELFVDNS